MLDPNAQTSPPPKPVVAAGNPRVLDSAAKLAAKQAALQEDEAAALAKLTPEQRAQLAQMKHVEKIRKERRLMVATIPCVFVQYLLQAGITWEKGPRPQSGKVALPTASPSLPPDTVVLHIVHQAQNDCWLVVLCSEEFEPVPEDKMPPVREAEWTWVDAELAVRECAPPPEARER